MGAGGAQPGSQAQWVLPVAEVLAWLEQAQPGDKLIYAHGPWLLRGETSAAVMALAQARRVDPTQPRSPHGGFDFIIQKRREPEPATAPRAVAIGDGVADVILRAFKREANLGLRASSNSALADLAHVPVATVAWIVGRLVREGVIRTQAVSSGKQAGWRWVTITATGKSTMPPPTIAAAIAAARRESPHGGPKGPPDLPGRILR